MDTLDISATSLTLAFVLLIVPLVINRIYTPGLVKTLANSVARMSIQLFLVGIFLKYLFDLNNDYDSYTCWYNTTYYSHHSNDFTNLFYKVRHASKRCLC